MNTDMSDDITESIRESMAIRVSRRVTRASSTELLSTAYSEYLTMFPSGCRRRPRRFSLGITRLIKRSEQGPVRGKTARADATTSRKPCLPLTSESQLHLKAGPSRTATLARRDFFFRREVSHSRYPEIERALLYQVKRNDQTGCIPSADHQLGYFSRDFPAFPRPPPSPPSSVGSLAM